MILRSGKRIGRDNLPIDFDEASKLWRKNKISIGYGQFKYKSKREILDPSSSVSTKYMLKAV